VIPPKANRKLPTEFDAEIYRERNKIERFFGRLKASFRRIANRYEKTSRNFLSMIKLASVRLWIEFYESAALVVIWVWTMEKRYILNSFIMESLVTKGRT